MSDAIRTHCVDTRALVKLFAQEPESVLLKDYLNKHGTLSVTSITFSETLGVLKTKWSNRLLTQTEYLAATEELVVSVFGGKFQIDDSVSLTDPETFNNAKMYCKLYSLDIADALQLAALKQGFFSGLAGESKPIMITADGPLAKAAVKEGLRVWNCRDSSKLEC